MEFKKVTITLPKSLCSECEALIKRGLFANMSDIVRAGIREQLTSLKEVSEDLDEKYVYNDKKLIAGVKKSEEQIRQGKGIRFKNVKEMRKYLEEL